MENNSELVNEDQNSQGVGERVADEASDLVSGLYRKAEALAGKPSHTPGPWKFTEGYEGDETNWAIHTDEDGPWVIARTEAACDENDLPGDQEDRANAHLLASAPTLYAALEVINVLACYSQENTDAIDSILLEIGNAARLGIASAQATATSEASALHSEATP